MKLLRWLITLAYAGFIFYLSSRSWGGVSLFPHSDKVIHFGLYFMLAGLCVWALRVTTLRDRAMVPHLGAMMAIIYGVTDELHQLYVPGREAAIGDIAADAAGAICGAAVAVRIARWMRKERS